MGLDVERVTGDLRDAASLARAVAGCGLLFHVAADYRLWARDPGELYRSNVDGTRNLLQAARQAGVERVVYTSTVGCIGIPPNGLGDEETPVSVEDMAGDYKRSKFLAEQVALEFARGGLPVVIVNPTAPVGDHDVKPTPTGKIVLDFLNGDMPAFIDTGLNVVDVRDTAEGHVLACERGRSGRALHSGFGESDAGPDPAETGADYRAQSAHHEASVCRGLLCRRMQHGLGGRHWKAAAGAARRRPHGAQEDVGDAPEGPAGTRLQPGAGGPGTDASRGMVLGNAGPRGHSYGTGGSLPAGRTAGSTPNDTPGSTPKMRLLFVASAPMEFPGILSHAIDPRPAKVAADWARTARLGSYDTLLVANGAGARQAAGAVNAALAVFQADAVVSIGFCGALLSTLAIADVVVATSIVSGVRCYSAVQPTCAAAHHIGIVCSIDHVAQTAREKADLRAAGGTAVEMEAAGVAEQAATRGLPLFCIRVVTDLAGEDMANNLGRHYARTVTSIQL